MSTMKGQRSARAISLCLVLCSISVAGAAIAQRPKIVAIADLASDGVEAPEGALARLTDAVYAAATGAPRDLYAVVSREKLAEELDARAEGDPARTPREIGTAAGADLVFTGVLRRSGGAGYEVTLTLVETVSGRALGLERASAADLDALWGELRRIAIAMLVPDTGPAIPAVEGADSAPPGFDVRVRARPDGAVVRIDDRIACAELPCTIHLTAGAHVFEVRADLFDTEERRVVVDRDAEVVFELQPRPYSYFGMNDAGHGGHALTVGVAPLAPGYKSITVFDGYTFAGLNPVCDVGFGGQVFGYRQAPRGDSWSILGFGPTVRLGRLILGADVQLLSFRPHSPDHGEGWLPGLTARAQLPLVNRREIGGWAVLVPTPAAGIDVWFHDLDYDQYQFWVGLSWVGGIGF